MLADVSANNVVRVLICTMSNGQEAAWYGNKNILASDSMLSLINHFKGVKVLSYPQVSAYDNIEEHQDLSDIKG
ncbi:MAG: hypothetical protein AB8U25_05015 [Rickettsiales endosymbiont of Dermacentor nuttalli]